MTARR